MRTEENRLGVNKLYLLGAGASYSLTKHSKSSLQKQAPLDFEFCKRIENFTSRFKWVQSAQNRIKSDWKDHHPFNEVGLEEAIVKQIGHFDFLNSIHPRKGTKRGINSYLYDITHLIAASLGKVEEDNKGIVKRFVNYVFPPNRPYEKQNNRIITFNYDTVLDKHLSRFKFTEIYFDQIRTEATRARQTRVDGKKEYPLLIKLHGSINWKIPRNDFDNILNGEGYETNLSKTKTFNTKGCYFVKTVLKDDAVPSTEDDQAPLIIPPLPQKPITNISLFRYLWTYAYEYLHECNELIICGYSLPETDTLAVSMFSNFSNMKIRKIRRIQLPSATELNPILLTG